MTITTDKIKAKLEDNAIPIMVGVAVVAYTSIAVVSNKYTKANHVAYCAFLHDKNRILADSLGLTIDTLTDAILKK